MSKVFPTPLLSIVIPCWNEADHIESCLQQLKVFKNSQVEIIVVDGGSSDRTRQLAEPLADKLLQSARGRAVQMNTGALAAQGQWLLFQHVDTRLPEDIADWLQALQSGTSLWGFFNVRLSGRQTALRVIGLMMTWRSRITAIATGDQCQWVRRDVFRGLQGFAEWPLMEDIDLSRRLKKQGNPMIWRTPVTTSSRRWEKRGILRTVLLMWWLRLAFFLGVRPGRLQRWYYGTITNK